MRRTIIALAWALVFWNGASLLGYLLGEPPVPGLAAALLGLAASLGLDLLRDLRRSRVTGLTTTSTSSA